MSESKLCRLCLITCYDGKGLYADSEVFEITTKYFDPMFLKLKEHLTVVCFECWCHIVDFHNFQERILQAQRTFAEDDNQLTDVVAKLEIPECPEDVVTTVYGSGDPSDELFYGDDDIKVESELISLSSDEEEIKVETAKLRPPKEEATTPETVPNLECVFCRVTYRTYDELKAHFREKHPTEKFHFFCCQVKFDLNLTKYEEHILAHIDPTAYRCDLCHVTFKWKATLKNHLCLKRVKSQATDAYSCKECGLTTDSASNLRRHVYKVHTKRKFKCTLCPKAYTARSTLDEHMSVHTGEYPFVCQHCPAKFRYRSMLRQHLMQNHAS